MIEKGKILILGSGSFLAKQTLDFMLKEGFAVFTVSRGNSNNTAVNEHFIGSCFNHDFLSEVIAKVNPEVILSFIGGPSVNGRYSKLLQLNCGVLELLNRFSLDGVRIISLGSAAEYGAADMEYLSEDGPVLPSSDYGHAKLAQSALAVGFNQVSRSNVSILRVFNLFGKGTPASAISEKIHQKVKNIAEGESLVLDDPEMARDFLDVQDVACGIVSFIKSDSVSGIYNLCSGRSLSLAELASAFLKESGKASEVKAAVNPRYFSLVRRAVGSNVKFLNSTGWLPQQSLQDSVRAQIGIS